MADEKTIYACNAWDNKYGFGPDGTALFWVGGQHVAAEELSSPAYDVLAACIREIGQYGGATLPIVEAFDCETRTAYVVLAADLTDVAAENMGDSGKALRVGMRPCPGAPRPLIAAVAQTDAAGPYTVVTDASQAL